MKIGLSVTVLSIGAVVAVNDISVAVARPSYIESVAVASPKLIFSSSERPEVLEQTNLVSESVFVNDTTGNDTTLFEIDLVKGAATLRA